MKFKFVLMQFLLACSLVAYSQSDLKTKPKIYNVEADAKSDIKAAVAQAKAEDKHVLIQVGGDWCSWCHRFNQKVSANDTLRTVLDENYVSYHLNYSKENKNLDVLASLGFPQRMGFPVFIILDGNGNRIHTQNSVYLELGKGYSTAAVLDFFKHWTPKAVSPMTYNENKN